MCCQDWVHVHYYTKLEYVLAAANILRIKKLHVATSWYALHCSHIMCLYNYARNSYRVNLNVAACMQA